MEQSFKIRPAMVSNVDTIFSFISHLEERSFDFKSFRDRYTINLDDPEIIYLVAINESDEVIGFISCYGQNLLHHEGKVFEIQEIYVARNFRDRGIGKALIQAMEERLSKTDCEVLEVSTHIKRADARRFYAKMGFVQTHVKFAKEL